MKKLGQSEWKEFVKEADGYNGPKTIGQMFCEFFGIVDAEVKTASEDRVWQLIAAKYLSSNRKDTHNGS